MACAVVCLAFAAFGLSGGREMFLLGLWGFFVLAFAVFCLSGGRGKILLSSLHQPANVFLSRRACAVFCSCWFRGSPAIFDSFCWRRGDRQGIVLLSSRGYFFCFALGLCNCSVGVA